MRKSVNLDALRFLLFLSSLFLLCSTSWLILAELRTLPAWIKTLIFLFNTALVLVWVVCIEKKTSRQLR